MSTAISEFLLPMGMQPTFQITVLQDNKQNSFHIALYKIGRNEMYIYKLRSKIKGASAKTRTGEFEESDCNFKLEFVTSFISYFPILSVVVFNNKLLAVGNYDFLDVNDAIFKQRHHVFKPRGYFKDISKHINRTGSFSEARQTSKDNSVLCVDACMDKYLVICCLELCSRRWLVEVIVPGETKFLLTTIPLSNQAFLQFSTHATSELSDSRPCLSWARANKTPDTSQRGILTKLSFRNFFGAECFRSTDLVILIGFPDGRVFWHPLLKSATESSSQKTQNIYKSQLLCDIEQPVIGIHILSQHSGIDGDSLLIVGALGKAVVLETSFNTMSSPDKAFSTKTFYIPSPIKSHFLINSTIYISSTNGQLWKSTLKNNSSGDAKTCPIISNIKDVSVMFPLIPQKDLIIFVSFDGCLNLGNLESTRNDQCYLSNKQSYLLNVSQQCSTLLLHLESVKEMQKVLFQQMILLLKVCQDRSLSNPKVTVEIGEQIQLRAIFPDVEGLQNVATNFWNLGISVHRCFNGSLSSCKKLYPFHSDELSLSLNISEAYACFGTFFTLPWLVVCCLVFHIPEDWRKLDEFQSVNKIFPIYVSTGAIVMHHMNFIPIDNYQDTSQESVINRSIRNYHKKNIYFLIDQVKNRHTFESSAAELSRDEVTSQNSLIVNLPKRIFDCETFCNGNVHTSFCIWMQTTAQSRHISTKCLSQSVKIALSSTRCHYSIMFTTKSLKLLVALKFAVLHDYLEKEKDREVNTSTSSVSIASGIFSKLKFISEQMSTCLCSNDGNIVPGDVLQIYNNLRKELTEKMCLY